MSNTVVRDFPDDSGVQDAYVQNQGSRRGIIDTRRRHQWLVSLKDFRCKGIHRCRRCPVSIDIPGIW